MLQLVTASLDKRSRSSIIISAETLLEGTAPARVPYVSPEQRHPRAIVGHGQPIHMKQKHIVNKSVEMKKCECSTSMAVLNVWICIR